MESGNRFLCYMLNRAMQGLDVLYQGHNHVGANLLNCLILFP